MKLNLILVCMLSAMFTLTGCTDAEIASSNLKKAAEEFEIERRIVFYNGITSDYILTIEGRCSTASLNGRLAVTCKTVSVVFQGCSEKRPTRSFAKPANQRRKQLNEFTDIDDNDPFDEVDEITAKRYTYKTMDDYEPGDFAIVSTPDGRLKVTQVVEVHAVPQIDVESNVSKKWLIQRVDFTAHDEINRREAQFSQELLKLQHESVRKNASAMIAEQMGITEDSLLSLGKVLNGDDNDK